PSIGLVPTTVSLFFFNNPPPTEIYTLSLHDALPIFRRHDGMDDASHQAVALKAAQRLSKHLLRNSANRALQFGITHRSASQDLNNERRPFVGNPVEHKS